FVGCSDNRGGSDKFGVFGAYLGKEFINAGNHCLGLLGFADSFADYAGHLLPGYAIVYISLWRGDGRRNLGEQGIIFFGYPGKERQDEVGLQGGNVLKVD